MNHFLHEITKNEKAISQFTETVGISKGAVQYWRRIGRFPYNRILELERILGIPRHEIAPELFNGYTKIN